MTHEWHPADGVSKGEDEREMEDVLEQHLKLYYGPELPEQQLPESSWQQVFSKLGPQRPFRPRARQRPKRHFGQSARLRVGRRRYSSPLRLDVQDSFTRVLFAAHMPRSSERMLACRSSAHLQVPTIRFALLRRCSLRLILPMHIAIKPEELDVLLASGLAHYEEMRRPTSILVYILSTCTLVGLLAWTIITLVLQGLSLFTRFLNMFVCIVLIGIVLWLLHLYARKLAQKADIVMVRWIGRFQACQGLHALADRSPVPSQRKLGELSLTERIARVCGTRVPIHEERFTLVR